MTNKLNFFEKLLRAVSGWLVRSSTNSLMFGHYAVLFRDGRAHELGRGATGVTYKARNTRLRGKGYVALKVIHDRHLTSAKARERFEREAEAASNIEDRRNVAAAIDLIREGNTFCYVMEFVDGETLTQFVERRGPAEAWLTLNIAGQLARALDAAHRVGIVHRDVKPDNVMLAREGDSIDERDPLVKLIDFSLAKTAIPGGALAESGFAGTYDYSSPEQLMEREPDIRSDLYSLGATLWFLLTGYPPFDRSPASLIKGGLDDDPPIGRLNDAQVPKSLENLLVKLLAKDPGNRFDTPKDLRQAIAECQKTVQTPATPETGVNAGVTVTPITTPGGTVVLPSSRSLISGPPLPRIGDVLGYRQEPGYLLEALLSEHITEGLFRVTEQETAKTFALRLLPAGISEVELNGLRANLSTYFSNEHETLRVVRYIHPGSPSFLLAEWVEGARSLDDILRQRQDHRLTIQDVLDVAPALATAADHAAEHGLSGLDFSPSRILLGPPSQPGAKPDAVKVDTLPAILSGLTPKADRTQNRPPISIGANGAVRSLAKLFVELLGGAPITPGRAGIRPIAGLNEATNTILSDALRQRDHGFINAAAFVGELIRAAGASRPSSPKDSLPPPPPPAASTLWRKISWVVVALCALFLIGKFALPHPAPDPRIRELLEDAQQAWHISDYEQVLAKCAAALTLNSELSLAYARRADANEALGRGEQVEADRRKAISIIPTDTLSYFGRGIAYYRLKQFDQAILDYDKAIKLDPKFAKAYHNRGVVYDNLKQYERAVADFTKAVELDPKYAFAYSGRGSAYYSLKQYERAVADFDKAINLDSKYAFAYNSRGYAYGNLKQHERAMADFDKAIELNPKYTAAYKGRGVAHFHFKQYDRAVVDFTKAIELDPKDAFAHNYRGDTYNELKQYEAAVADYTKVIVLDPKNINAYYNRGRAYIQLHQFDLAMADCNKVIEFDPKNNGAYFGRGIAYAGLKQPESAVADFNKAIELDPKDVSAYNSRGITHQILKQYDRAVADFTVSIDLNPKDASAYKNRADAYRSLGKTAEAERDFAKFKELTEPTSGSSSSPSPSLPSPSPPSKQTPTPKSTPADPSELFLRAFTSVQQAETAERDGKLDQAMSKYRFAVTLLDEISQDHPNWQPLIVSYRKGKTAASITKLQQNIEGRKLRK